MKPAKNILKKAKTTTQDPFSTQEQCKSQQIYSYISEEIKQSMVDKYYHYKTTSKFYKNNIFNNTNKYNVPVDDPLKKISTENQSYNDFYRTHKKFAKPYGDNTKYIDTISRNKQILRRAHCDTPVTMNVQNKTSIDLSSKKKSRYFKKVPQTVDFQLNASSQGKNHNLFEKTIKTQCQVFRNLLSKERSCHNERRRLNNSLNRLIAAESIYEKVNDLLSVNSKASKSQF